MNKILIDNKQFGCHIYPRFDKVYVEIYYTSAFSSALSPEIHIISNEFGSTWRKPIEHDYDLARQWALMQLKCIENANK